MKKLFAWIPSILWASLIFVFSAQPAVKSSAISGRLIKTLCTFIVSRFKTLSIEEQNIYIESLQFLVRKTAHLTVFLILGILVMLALFSYDFTMKKIITFTLIICFAYACSDEIHQIFVEGRAGRMTDVAIDFTGSSIGVFLMWSWNKIKEKYFST